MSKSEEQDREEQDRGVQYQVRRLTDRWVHPLGTEVVSTHGTRDAALSAYDREPQAADDGTGRSTMGSFVPSVVVRIHADGREEAVARRTGDGRW